MARTWRVCIVGTGNIAAAHAEALKGIDGVRIGAAVDPSEAARTAFAAKWGAEGAFANVEQALASGSFDAAHILTPPDHHSAPALATLAAGLPTLVEKPLAVSTAECDALIQAAEAGRATLAVNQNFVHHPSFRKLRALMESGAIGPISHVACVYRAPLRQLASRQFGHWMFRKPVNILLEQAVHPLSQVRALVGPLGGFVTRAGRVDKIGSDIPLLRQADVMFEAERCPVSLHFEVGADFPVWQLTAYGSDGIAIADMYRGQCYVTGRTRWMEPVDLPLTALRTASSMIADTVGRTIRYSLSQIKLVRRSDVFFESMASSVADFYDCLASQQVPETNGAFGAELVRVCEEIAHEIAPAPAEATAVAAEGPEAWDVAVLGGTGFIGTHTVRALVDRGWRVGVMARNTVNLDPIFSHPNVRVLRGDVKNPDDISRAIGPARFVVNLAHGGGGANLDQIRAAMLGSAQSVANICREKKVERLLHVGSIASLYLGPDAGIVRDDTPSDPYPEARNDYARVKAETDTWLLDAHKTDGLPVVILRPGLVVGEGTSPFHGGLGIFNNEQHCIGWSSGRHPLPWILAEDVASAIVQALEARGIDGKTYNLVGDARPSAREFLEQYARVSGRPLVYHSGSPTRLWLTDVAKWMIKRIGGRRVALPSRRDVVSRGLYAIFDCGAAKADLDWSPVSELTVFYERALPRPGA
ncbi:NAD-dependent epimerase/dehydratase family protein [Futiania mangrovi]|uniref:NAD-dependent epimerase/dehydratase family protein n=1 Tax=Futiania mangrovi TaxID=2959716 RepID=A0A9J6PBV8_9PROT|nr:NAD-dependent epimerase/dehydratase family protein [Futiania mangrovii]MCP1337652.1 NAD-dependent epimerase/dehydratase family protein [Futiania mangrovii]